MVTDIADLKINDRILINGNVYQIREKNEERIIVTIIEDNNQWDSTF